MLKIKKIIFLSSLGIWRHCVFQVKNPKGSPKLQLTSSVKPFLALVAIKKAEDDVEYHLRLVGATGERVIFCEHSNFIKNTRTRLSGDFAKSINQFIRIIQLGSIACKCRTTESAIFWASIVERNE